MEIRELRQDSITDADADELARLRTLVDPRRHALDPPVSRQLTINELRPSVATYALNYWGLFDGAQMVALADSQGALNAENADVCEIGVWVDPDRLGEGMHHRLFDHVSAFERARGRTRFWGWGTLGDEPTRAFWEDDLGYTLAYDERISRCVLADTDAELMQSWVDRAPERASGYHLEFTSAPMPDHLIGYFAEALEAMNDAPADDLDFEPDTYDADRARQIEQIHLATRSDYRSIIAIETATGAFAGYTAIRIPEAEPALSKQGDTVTHSAHRGQGIGRWIKAAMWQWLRSERPEVVSLDTGNAESNRGMLDINEAMGFEDILHHGVWHKPS